MLLMASITGLLKCKSVLFKPPSPQKGRKKQVLDYGTQSLCKVIGILLKPSVYSWSLEPSLPHTPTPHLDKKYEVGHPGGAVG